MQSEKLLQKQSPLQASPKKKTFFGYLPLREEIFPAKPKLVPNCIAGVFCGLRVLLMCNGYSAIIFLQSAQPGQPGTSGLIHMMPTGVKVMVYSSAVGLLLNGLFGRVQYSIADPQGICMILLGQMAATIANTTTEETSGSTMLWAISITSFVTGATLFLAGKAGFGRAMQGFPNTAVNGFLGGLGYSLFKDALELASGVKWAPAWPEDIHAALTSTSLEPLAAMAVMIFALRNVPSWLRSCFGPNSLWSSLVTLAPFLIFWIVASSCGGASDSWMFEKSPAESFTAVWEKRPIESFQWSALLQGPVLGQMFMIAFIVLVTEPLQFASVTASFITAEPLEGDPDPYGNKGCPIDVDLELTQLGFGSMLLALGGGCVSYHSGGNSAATRNEGGTHRIASIVSSLMLLVVFVSGFPVETYMPKFFLAGILGNIGISFFINFIVMPYIDGKVGVAGFLKAAACVVVTAASGSILYGIGVSVFGAMVTTLQRSASASHVTCILPGSAASSKVMRPYWERKPLEWYMGRQVTLLQLSGSLFFGTVTELEETIQSTISAGYLRTLIIDFRNVETISESVVALMFSLRVKLKALGINAMFCSLRADHLALFEKASMLTPRGFNPFGAIEQKSFEGVVDCKDVDSALRICEEMILDSWYNDTVPGVSSSVSVAVDSPLPPTKMQRDYFAACHRVGSQCSDEAFADVLGMSTSLLPRLRALAQVQKLPENSELSTAGSVANKLFIVRSGRLDIVDIGYLRKDGDRSPKKVMFEMWPGRIAGCKGFHAFPSDRYYYHSFQTSAGCESEIWTVTRDALSGIQDRDRELYNALYETTVAMLSCDSDDLARSTRWKLD